MSEEADQHRKSVHDHAEHEENEEFPTLMVRLSAEERIRLGGKFLAAFRAAG